MLVDRLWPRGIAKAEAPFDEWAKDVAPSTELRRWFGHDPARFEDFAGRYRAELALPPASDAFRRLRRRATDGGLVLVTATCDVAHSAAEVLLGALTGPNNEGSSHPAQRPGAESRRHPVLGRAYLQPHMHRQRRARSCRRSEPSGILQHCKARVQQAEQIVKGVIITGMWCCGEKQHVSRWLRRSESSHELVALVPRGIGCLDAGVRFVDDHELRAGAQKRLTATLGFDVVKRDDRIRVDLED